MEFIPFEKWTPDFRPKTKNLVIAQNVVRDGNKLIPVHGSLAFSTNTVTGSPLLIADFPQAGQFLSTAFVPTTTGIYRLDANAFTDLSKVGGYNLSLDSETWAWTVYGNAIIFSSLGEPTQIINPASTGTAADLGGTPPRGMACAMYRDHLFLGNVIEGSTPYVRRLWRSAKGNLTTWTPSSSNGCGYQDIAAWGEEIKCLKPLGDSLIVYMDRSIWAVDEIGPPLWFSHTQIATGVGAVSPNSVVQVDRNLHIFLGAEDIYILTPGGVQPIGEGIRTYYRDKVDLNRAHLITSAVDRRKKNVYFLFYSTEDATGFPSRCFCFNYLTNEFFEMQISVQTIGLVPVNGMLIDTMHSQGLLDDLTEYTIDSSFYNAEADRIGVIDTDGAICLMVGDPLNHTLSTGEIDFGDVITINQMRPVCESPQGTLRLRIYYRNRDNEDTSFKDAYMNANGTFDLRVTARYMTFRVDITGFHQGIMGLKYEPIVRSKR